MTDTRYNVRPLKPDGQPSSSVGSPLDLAGAVELAHYITGADELDITDSVRQLHVDLVPAVDIPATDAGHYPARVEVAP